MDAKYWQKKNTGKVMISPVCPGKEWQEIEEEQYRNLSRMAETCTCLEKAGDDKNCPRHGGGNG